MKKVVVLGAGLVGKTIAIDLSRKFDVTSIDKNVEALKDLERHPIKLLNIDISDTLALSSVLAPFDLVVGAVPGFLGFRTARTVIEAGKNMVDISFFPEDPFELHELALRQNVTLLVDCGVAPGMGNIILGYHNSQMTIHSYECLVGGLPLIREWPYDYKAVFSPIDVIEEYVRPARYVQHGQLVVKEALSDPELVHFDGVGTLECWNSDGLRSLIYTMSHIPHMIEKTLRYPGSIEYLRVLRASGFFSHELIDVNGTTVRPIDVTAKLLFPRWKLKPGEEEFTVMRVRMVGNHNGKLKTIQYNLLDRTDVATGTLSMARTTGYTCTAAVNLLAEGRFTRKGVCPPEYLGEDENNFGYIVRYLEERDVNYSVEEV